MKESNLNYSFKALTVYKKAYELTMLIFELSKSFPKEERYSLSDQIRRSSRSDCSSVAEAYPKRLYKRHFVSIFSDADMENSETRVWLAFASACGYLSKEKFEEVVELSLEIGKLLNHMINHPELYQRKNEKALSIIFACCPLLANYCLSPTSNLQFIFPNETT